MKLILLLWIDAMLICALQVTAADIDAGPGTSILVAADQLQKGLSDTRLRVLDVRSQDEYAKAHVPGASRVDVGDWKNLAVAEHGLHDAKAWSDKVGSLGITNKSHVVVYGGNVSDAARIWWLLKYVGVKDVALLDGGWDWWSKNDRPVKESTPQRIAAEFRPEFQADRLAEFDSVKNSLESKELKIVDTRSDDEFADGRIPDSVHLEWTHLLADGGRFKTREQLDELFRKQGIVPADTAVCY